jgi:hypothetical protein
MNITEQIVFEVVRACGQCVIDKYKPITLFQNEPIHSNEAQNLYYWYQLIDSYQNTCHKTVKSHLLQTVFTLAGYSACFVDPNFCVRYYVDKYQIQDEHDTLYNLFDKKIMLGNIPSAKFLKLCKKIEYLCTQSFRKNKCNVFVLNLDLEDLGHRNLLIFFKVADCILVYLYEPLGNDMIFHDLHHKIVQCLNWSNNRIFGNFIKKYKVFNISTCPRGLQMFENLFLLRDSGYCVMFSYMFLYFVLTCSKYIEHYSLDVSLQEVLVRVEKTITDVFNVNELIVQFTKYILINYISKHDYLNYLKLKDCNIKMRNELIPTVLLPEHFDPVYKEIRNNPDMTTLCNLHDMFRKVHKKLNSRTQCFDW